MPPISSRPGMNSRATGLRSHRSRIRSRGRAGMRSAQDGLAEPADQSAQRGVGSGFIPVIEDGIERRLVPDGADHGAKDGGHPKKSAQDVAEGDAGKNAQQNQKEHKRGGEWGR